MIAKGVNGQIEFDGKKIVIRRNGFVAVMTQGFKGEKTIALSSITSVQFKSAGGMVNGYIQFAFQGGAEAKGGVMQATKDENTVMFRVGSQQSQFEALRAAVEAAMLKQFSPTTSMADELKKLADLRVAGILTPDEFDREKKKLLT